MMWNEQIQQEARELVEALNDTQWNALRMAIPALLKLSTPEQVKAQQERKEQVRAKQEALQDDFRAKRDTFKRWREKKLNGMNLPGSYDFTMTEISPLCDYALHELAGHEGFFDTLAFMYDWGFKRGAAYQKGRKQAKSVENG